MDCFVADAPRNDGERGRNDGEGSGLLRGVASRNDEGEWIASRFCLSQ